jgi:integrase
LKLFFDSVGIPGGSDLEEQGKAFLEKAQQDRLWASQQIMFYLDGEKERVLRKEIAAGTLRTLWQPIKAFCDAYIEILPTINWKRISKSMPSPIPYSDDRIPTIDEIRKLCEYYDRRIKPIIYVMSSSGIRIGAWDYLKWKHVVPKRNEKGEIIAASLLVYAGEKEKYTTYITPEAYNALKEYMDFRASYGEQITAESWLMRDYFRTADIKRIPNKHGNMRGGKIGVAAKPKKFTSHAMNRMLLRALHETGLRESLGEGQRRYEYKTAHAYRKYFKTRAEQVMNRLNVEYLMSHSVGLHSNYYRPTDEEMLKDYLKAVPLLTISLNLTDVKKQQEILEEKQKKKEEEIQELREEQQKMRQMLVASMRSMASMGKMLTGVDKDSGTVSSDKVMDWIKDAKHMFEVFGE